MADSPHDKPHFFLPQNGRAEPYAWAGAGGGGTAEPPARDRPQHGGQLRQQLEQVQSEIAAVAESQKQQELESGIGLQVAFTSFPEVELAFNQLARESSGIELYSLNQNTEGTVTTATVFVPDGKLDVFERKITAYLDERKGMAGQSLDNHRLIDAIAEIRRATIDALWTDAPDCFPTQEEGQLWWEVWLPVRRDRDLVQRDFRRICEQFGINVSTHSLDFPERMVVQILGSLEQLTDALPLLNCVAELRRAKETAAFFNQLPVDEQSAWVDDLLSRTTFAEYGDDVAHVCVLDTGVNQGHPLLSQSLANDDLHTVEPDWGVDDQHGHGTSMAGLALFGDLTSLLDSDEPLHVGHRLESVKLINAEGESADGELFGWRTQEAMSRVQVTSSDRLRNFMMPITSDDGRDRGSPTSWSSRVDALVADADEYGAKPQLMMISAGNVGAEGWPNYPDSNTTAGIEDPAQAWNALTIGALTHKTKLEGDDVDGYEAIAKTGGLSPHSRSSATWDSAWPVKPEVVFEGGNAAVNDGFASEMDSLDLLSVNHQPFVRSFTTTRATSAATALSARFMAELQSRYPNMWPETARGLMVHSARWTDAMYEMFLGGAGLTTKSQYTVLRQHCGYGEPELASALHSASNSLTLIAEDSLQPYQENPGSEPKYGEMQLHDLPWPRDQLAALGSVQVGLRVTLSYFIEPNPSARGHKSRYAYPSAGLKFDLRRVNESSDAFRRRINKSAQEDGADPEDSPADLNWMIGTQARHRGSLHQDIWQGNAADLADCGLLAVYPSAGWWKSRKKLEQFNRRLRYSLIVSIDAPSVDVDLYTEIEQQLIVPITV